MIVPPIVVLGPERSGTSAWTEMVHVWGAYVGEADQLPAPDELNPRGRWEYGPLWEFLALLGDFESGVSWWEESFGDRVAAKAKKPEIVDRARALMARMESAGRPWVWKDPALCHFLGFWEAIWEQPIFLITVRHPVDVARSWQQFTRASHSELSLPINLLRWQYMTLSVLRATEASTTKLFVEYEQLVSEPDQQARLLAEFLDRHFSMATTQTVIERMASACDQALWRNRSSNHDSANRMTDSQRSLYRLQRAKVHDPQSPFIDDFPMPVDWRTVVIGAERAAQASRRTGIRDGRRSE